jgi:type I restriction enzyme S subunit
VAALRRVQGNLKRYRAAVLKAACEGRLLPTEAEWEQATLGEVSTVLAGYGFPERLQGRSTGDIGFFKVGDISGAWKRNEKVLTQANHYISKADLAELRAKVLPTGTVVFAKIGAAIALNRRAIIGEPSLVDNNVMGLHAGERIHPRFLFHFLCTQKLDELARATTVPSIRKGDVEGIELKLPPLAEQTRIVAEVERRLSVVEELEAVVSANLQRATRLRQAVLPRAFEGRLVERVSSALQ